MPAAHGFVTAAIQACSVAAVAAAACSVAAAAAAASAGRCRGSAASGQASALSMPFGERGEIKTAKYNNTQAKPPDRPERFETGGVTAADIVFLVPT